jgi:hypothetical protein
MSPTHLGEAVDERPGVSPEPGEAVENAEIFSKIDKELPVALRESYLKLKSGLRIPADEQRTVIEAIRELLGVELE